MISIIAAIGKNRELGKNNALLWHIPGELPRFKRITTGHPIIMGRKTFESIGRVLPNRLNVVITRDVQSAESKGQSAENLVYVSSLEEAIETSSKYYVVGSKYEQKRIHDTNYNLHTTDENEIFIIGGGQIFEQALPIVDKLYLTLVDQAFDADTFFPDYSAFSKEVEKEEHEDGGYKYSFVTLMR